MGLSWRATKWDGWDDDDDDDNDNDNDDKHKDGHPQPPQPVLSMLQDNQFHVLTLPPFLSRHHGRHPPPL
jgi:hypothetical protein